VVASPPLTIHDHWLTEMVSAETVEPAATAVMSCALAEAAALVPDDLSLRRALVHARPGGTYRGLLVLQTGRQRLRAPRDPQALLPSLTAWRAVEAHRRPVAVDVTTGALTWLADDGTERVVDARIDGGQSRVRLLSRDTTHVLVLPLRAGNGTVGGMLAIEASHPEGVGASSPWGAAVTVLERIAGLAGPFLLSLPGPAPAPQTRRDDPLLPVVGRKLAETLDVLEVFARQDETLLIRGPTGAGKSRLARWCHERSRRRDRAYEVVDLLAIPAETQMGELFGWKKGAFTGAARDHEGFVARARGGTLFIDEIDKLSMSAQAGLLTLLEEHTYRPLGHQGPPLEADVRFVVGSNADLEEAVKQGRFREDLFYRIDVLPVRLPALAERVDEISDWARFMLDRRVQNDARPGVASFEENALGALETAPWPGNLRQLDNVVRRAYLHALVDHPEGDPEVRIAKPHVLRALGVGTSAQGAAPLMAAYRAAAAAFLTYAREKADAGKTLDLDWAGTLAGFVLERGTAAGIDRETLFEMLGKAQLVKGRNHHRALRREAAKIRELLELLGEDTDEAMAAFLES